MLEAEAPVLLIDNDQDGDFDDTTVIAITTSVEDDDPLVPRTYSLSQNYPNPFNPSTTIEFSLGQSSDVRIDVFNILGRRVATVLNTKMGAGSHSVEWSGTDDRGQPVSSGIYFYRMVADGFSASRKMILLK